MTGIIEIIFDSINFQIIIDAQEINPYASIPFSLYLHQFIESSLEIKHLEKNVVAHYILLCFRLFELITEFNCLS